MGQRIGKRTNDGNKTGLKQDKFRNSEFEYEQSGFDPFAGVSRASANTINGPWAENRGRRGDQDWREDNPFENGKLYNWNRKQGWDQYYENPDSPNRGHGGSLVHHDFGALRGNSGKGPRGYTRNDTRVYEDVCELLTRDGDVDATDIDVSVEGGVVTLSGRVENRDMKRYAGNIIDHIPGVKDVQNLLEFERR